ncbi:hypothetical protein Salat_1705700 [Sesamum alatum]|uniref:Uncharacterized protein n=1 Tax=Sesamum alatum TaxID=300844 RepID=A0AAE2CK43_9LAMI|nr:hypothetical protein Salat_1705700 [Sesamum alatum]
MAVRFSSYIDTFVEALPAAFKAASVPQCNYVEDSQNVAEFIEKLFNRLSVLLFHIDKQMNKVLMQGIYLPKKLNQWAKEARALKCQVSDLLQKQQNTKGNPPKLEDLIEMGVKMINHLKKCPSKDEHMYDKPIPIIILTRESGLDKPGTISELKYRTERKYYSHSEGKKMELSQQKNEQSVHPSKSQDVIQDQDAGIIFSSAEKSLPAVELKERNDSVTAVEKIGSELMSTSESIRGW